MESSTPPERSYFAIKLSRELSGSDRQQLVKHYTENTEAFRLYIQGRYFWNKHQYDFDYAGAEAEFKRAIELNPYYATAHQWYSDLLDWLGRPDEALREAQLAQQNDPLSLAINAQLGDCFLKVGQVDGALAQLRKTLEMDPNFIRTHQSNG